MRVTCFLILTTIIGSICSLARGINREVKLDSEFSREHLSSETLSSGSRGLASDQSGDEFEVEDLIAKGRIGRRIWYKVKWKGYPESDNSWVKKKDVGTGAIKAYEIKHPEGEGEFRFDQVISKTDIDGVTLYEVRWQGQPATENIWVEKSDLPAKIVATFDTSS